MNMTQFVRGEMVVVAILSVWKEILIDIIDSWLCNPNVLTLAGSNTVDIPGCGA